MRRGPNRRLGRSVDVEHARRRRGSHLLGERRGQRFTADEQRLQGREGPPGVAVGEHELQQRRRALHHRRRIARRLCRKTVVRRRVVERGRAVRGADRGDSGEAGEDSFSVQAEVDQTRCFVDADVGEASGHLAAARH